MKKNNSLIRPKVEYFVMPIKKSIAIYNKEVIQNMKNLLKQKKNFFYNN